MVIRFRGKAIQKMGKPEQIIQCEAPKIAKLFYNSNKYGLWYL